MRSSARQICNGFPDHSVSQRNSIDFDEVGYAFIRKARMDSEIELHSNFTKIRLLDRFATFPKAHFEFDSPKLGIFVMNTARALDVDSNFFRLLELFDRFDLGRKEMRSLKQ